MKINNEHLDRLFRAASQAHRLESDELDFATEARLMATWRRKEIPSNGSESVTVLRHGLVCACILMVACITLSLIQGNRQPVTEWQYANTLTHLTLNR
jgi:hypothetical protein